MDAQRSFRGALSGQLDLVFELGLVVRARLISVCNECQRRTVFPLLIPKHEHQTLVVMAAVNLDLAALLDNQGWKLLKYNSTSLNCGVRFKGKVSKETRIIEYLYQNQ